MTISLTGGETANTNPTRMAGASSMAMSQQTEGPQTSAGIEEPAAVVSKSLEQLNTAAAESRVQTTVSQNERGNGTEAPDVTFHKGLTELLDEPPSEFAERVQTEITTSAEIAVLAQAQQLPGGPMPYSGEA